QKMIAKQACDRYQTMTDVIRDLEACRSGSPSAATGPVASETEETRSIPSPKALGARPTTSKTATATRQTAAPATAVDAATEATLLSSDAAQATDAKKLTSPGTMAGSQAAKRQKAKRPSASLIWWRDRRVQAGVGLAAVLIMAVVILLQ